MVVASSKKLGRGLSALIADDYSDNSNINVTDDNGRSGLRELALTSIQSGKFQPRSRFDEQYIKELAASIGKNGVMQPIVVRPIEAKGVVKYEIIAGERRWRAASLVGEVTIPAIIKDVDDQQALELALIENIQRQDLTPLEESRGYQRLMDEFSYTQEALSKTIGKSRSHIANLLRLLNLPSEVKEMLENGELSMGHARALMNATDPVAIAKAVVSRGLNVRQTENIARNGLEPAERKQPKGKQKLAKRSNDNVNAYQSENSGDIRALEATLSENMGLKVKIEELSGSHGQITLHYESLEELDKVLQALGA